MTESREDRLRGVLVALDDAEGLVLTLTREGWAARSLATAHLIDATYRLEGAKRALREAIEALDARPQQAIELTVQHPGPCTCLYEETRFEGNREGHIVGCPRYGSAFANEWRGNADRAETRGWAPPDHEED